jgi:hypothetical protein
MAADLDGSLYLLTQADRSSFVVVVVSVAVG